MLKNWIPKNKRQNFIPTFETSNQRYSLWTYLMQTFPVCPAVEVGDCGSSDCNQGMVINTFFLFYFFTIDCVFCPTANSFNRRVGIGHDLGQRVRIIQKRNRSVDLKILSWKVSFCGFKESQGRNLQLDHSCSHSKIVLAKMLFMGAFADRLCSCYLRTNVGHFQVKA